MAFIDRFRKVSSAPTNPHGPARARAFDVADLYRGAVAEPQAGGEAQLPLDEKLRHACFWIVNTGFASGSTPVI